MHVFVRQLDVLYHSKLPKLIISDGGVECLKWLALIAMTLDHVNKIIFKSQMPLMSEIGRIAMPLFSMVLAYNLARPSALQKNIHIRSIAKMLIFGVLALPFYMLAFESTKIIPLNIMFTLMLLTSMIYLIEKGGLYRELLVITLFILGGIFVDYLWFGLGYGLAAWYYCKNPDIKWLLILLGVTAGFYFVNNNYWALAALPIIFIATKWEIKLPRLRWFFYVYYPLHLAVLWVIK